MTETNAKKDTAQSNVGWAFLKKLPGLKEHLVFWLVATGGLLLDLYTKKAAFEYIGKHGPITVIDGFFKIVSVVNDGAAFNLFAGRMFFLTLISCAALVLIIAIFLFGGSKSILTNISMALLAGGICGNLYDRLFNDGLVRDFIDIVIWPGRHWPAFNVADSMLCIGVGLMLISSFIKERPCQKHGQQHK